MYPRSMRRSLWILAVTCVPALAAAPRVALSQPSPDSSGFVTTGDGVKLYYAIYGGGRDTVIVPGGVLLAPYLAPLREDATVVFYDPRGR